MTLDPNIIVNMLSLLGVVFLGYLNLRSKAESAELKNQLGQKLDEVRREFSQGYMQIPIAAEQRQNVLFRLDNIERELHGVRERVHSTANQIGALNLTVGIFAGWLRLLTRFGIVQTLGACLRATRQQAAAAGTPIP